MNLDAKVSELPKVGSFFESRLKKLGIRTIENLLHHYPSRYLDLSQFSPIATLRLHETAVIQGTIWEIKNMRTAKGKSLMVAIINDGTSVMEAVWFNQPFLVKSLTKGDKVNLAGKIEFFNRRLTLFSPEYEIIRPNNTETIHTGRLVPIYPETQGVSSKWLRRQINQLLKVCTDKLVDVLPQEVIDHHKLLNYADSIYNIHFPKSLQLADKARERLAFEELLLAQVKSLRRKSEWVTNTKAFVFSPHQERILGLIATLPFTLTNAQKKVLREILADLNKEQPMNRLLQGDVGSGKTVVAAIAIYLAFLNGKKSLLMAPAEILAEQHFKTVSTLLNPLEIKIGIVTSSKKDNLEADVLVGTQALLSKGIDTQEVGLVIIDEQHRFGVSQRAELRSKGRFPHFLTMTATPIPRTAALTLYGDLDLSVIDEMPEGRKIVKTYVVPEIKREAAYDFIKKRVREGEQTFIICPLIEPSETLQTVRSAKEEFLRLQEKFEGLSLGLVHGRLKSKEKETVIAQFRSGEIQILVATPVVEVGIDIPKATIMAIEGAERFGLASLHQLRGRVGRSNLQSYCLLFSDSQNPFVTNRLKNMEKHHVGLELAEIDLKTRGPGEIYGTAQSGATGFKIASLSDLALIQKSRQASEKLFKEDPNLKKFPKLLEKIIQAEKEVSPD